MKKLLLLILLSSFGLKLFVASISWVDGDEGNFLYDAYLMEEGLLPFRDYVARSPLLLFLIYIFIKLFGHTLFAGRLLPILLTTICGYLVYKLGEKVGGQKMGLVSSALFCFCPYSVFWSTTIKTGTCAALFSAAACYLFLKAEGKWRNYLMSGLLIGCGMLVRRVAALFLPAATLCLLYFFIRERRRYILCTLSFFLGVALPILFVIGYFAYKTSIAFILSAWWGAGGMHEEASVAAVPGFKEVVENLFNRYILGKKVYSFYLFHKEALYLIIPTLLFILLYLKALSKKVFKVLQFPLFLLLFLSLLLYIKWYIFVEDLPFTLSPFFLALLLLSYISLFPYVLKLKPPPINWKMNLLLLWLLFTCAGYAGFVKINLEYYFDVLLPLCIFSSFCIYGKRPLLHTLFAFSIFCSSAFYVQTHGRYRYWSQHTVKEVASWIKEYTRREESLFTGSTIVAFLAERRLLFDISHPIVFHGDGVRDFVPVHPSGYPSVQQIIKGLEGVKYVIWDERTWECYFKMHPALKEYVQRHYSLVRRINEVSIMRRKECL